jgi:trehalose 6-phosphate synthase
MSRTFVVSNRGPLTFRREADGALRALPAGGGLVSALAPLLSGGSTRDGSSDGGGGTDMAGSEVTWASVTMGAADREAASKGLMTDDHISLLPVSIDDDTYRQAYDVVANTTLWYCHHHLWDLPSRPRFDRHWRQAWEGYRTYNQAMADAVSAQASPGDTVLVQDYHFSLLGRMLAERRPDLRTAHFLHTPFADPSMLRVLPGDAVDELLAGLAGFGACGFHCHAWEAGFRACFAEAGADAGAGIGGLTMPATFVSPLAPDHEGLRAEAAGAACVAAADALRAEVGDRRILLRVDRIEPSKNIVRGMLAFEELLESHREWREKVVHVALVYPSRQGLAEYLAYGAEVAHVAERINHRHGTPGWTPIVLHADDNRPRSLAALTLYDVLLVNPVRDGLNLVAKEGPLLNAVDGVLVLSERAGAYEELGGAALVVNPFDVSGTAEALHAALAMGDDERAERAGRLRDAVLARTAADWISDQLSAARAPA